MLEGKCNSESNIFRSSLSSTEIYSKISGEPFPTKGGSLMKFKSDPQYPCCGRSLSLCFIPINPVVWFSVLMGYGDDKNMIGFYRVHQFVGELVKEALSYISTLCGPCVRKRDNSSYSLSHFLLKLASKT